MGQSGWTEVTLAGGVTLKWRNGHWAGAPAPASQAAACLLAVLADLGARLSLLGARLLLLGAWFLLLSAWLLLQGVRLLLLGVRLLHVAARLLLVGARLLLRGLWACARGLHMSMLVLARALRWLVGRLLLLVVALGTIRGYLLRFLFAVVAGGRRFALVIYAVDFEVATLYVTRRGQQASHFINGTGGALSGVFDAAHQQYDRVTGTVKLESSTLEPPPPPPPPPPLPERRHAVTTAPLPKLISPEPAEPQSPDLPLPDAGELQQTAAPTPQHTAAPIPQQTAAPTPQPIAAPTPQQTVAPTPQHIAAPTPQQTVAPTPQHTAAPTPRQTTPRVASPVSPLPLVSEPTQGVVGVCGAAGGKSPAGKLVAGLSVPSLPPTLPPPRLVCGHAPLA